MAAGQPSFHPQRHARVRANVRGLPPNRAVYEALDVVEAELGRVHALPESAGMATGR